MKTLSWPRCQLFNLKVHLLTPQASFSLTLGTLLPALLYLRVFGQKHHHAVLRSSKTVPLTLLVH